MRVRYILPCFTTVKPSLSWSSAQLLMHYMNGIFIHVVIFADGICHIYVDKSADIDMAKQIVLDAKTDYPAACNAMVCLILHENIFHIIQLQNNMISLF